MYFQAVAPLLRMSRSGALPRRTGEDEAKRGETVTRASIRFRVTIVAAGAILWANTQLRRAK